MRRGPRRGLLARVPRGLRRRRLDGYGGLIGVGGRAQRVVRLCTWKQAREKRLRQALKPSSRDAACTSRHLRVLGKPGARMPMLVAAPCAAAPRCAPYIPCSSSRTRHAKRLTPACTLHILAARAHADA